jgi:hypothetical protein
VELFMMHDALKDVIATMVKQWELRLTAIHLVDSHLCCDPNKYLSALLLSLSTMLHLELPHINVLSKMDLLEQCAPPAAQRAADTVTGLRLFLPPFSPG